MDGSELNGLSILVVEDEPLIAIDTACTIVQAGGTLVGPAYSLGEAFEKIENARIDAALLDINLRNEQVFRLADTLADRGVPIVFLTGAIWPVMPERHAGCRRVGKPMNPPSVIAALRSAVGRELLSALAS
jgi:Response regulator of the LytR/AlgR family